MILDKDLSQAEIDMYAQQYHGTVRKLAHMTEYCVLAVTLCIPLYAYHIRGIWLFLLAGFICVAFAATDEYHQTMVAGRGPSPRDVLIDSAGAFIGIVGTQLIGWAAVKSSRELEADIPGKDAAGAEHIQEKRRFANFPCHEQWEAHFANFLLSQMRKGRGSEQGQQCHPRSDPRPLYTPETVYSCPSPASAVTFSVSEALRHFLLPSLPPLPEPAAEESAGRYRSATGNVR